MKEKVGLLCLAFVSFPCPPQASPDPFSSWSPAPGFSPPFSLPSSHPPLSRSPAKPTPPHPSREADFLLSHPFFSKLTITLGCLPSLLPSLPPSPPPPPSLPRAPFSTSSLLSPSGFSLRRHAPFYSLLPSRFSLPHLEKTPDGLQINKTRSRPGVKPSPDWSVRDQGQCWVESQPTLTAIWSPAPSPPEKPVPGHLPPADTCLAPSTCCVNSRLNQVKTESLAFPVTREGLPATSSTSSPQCGGGGF